MHKFSGVYETLADAPDTQIDTQFKQRFLELAEKEDFNPIDLLQILDECAFASLASDFAMQAMHFLFEDMCKEKGLDSIEIAKVYHDGKLNITL